jgi:3-isopropylmalate dehydrogenase
MGLLLDHLGLSEDAARIEKAVMADLSGRTPGRERSTSQVGDAIAGSV